MRQERNSNNKTVLNYLVATLLIFGFLSWLSYHNGMAYDGLNTLGFPFTYYSEGTGQSIATGQTEHFNKFSLLALSANLICSSLIYLAAHFLFKIGKRRS